MSEVQYSRFAWRWNDLIYLVGTSVAALVLGALVIGTIVIGGGGLLLVASPLLLFTAPLWIPPLLISICIGGGVLLCGGGGFLTFLSASWIWQMIRGSQVPPEYKDTRPAQLKQNLEITSEGPEKESRTYGEGPSQSAENELERKEEEAARRERETLDSAYPVAVPQYYAPQATYQS